MPKSQNNLWNQIIDWENLVLAAKMAAKNKRTFPTIIQFNSELEFNLLSIKRDLIAHTWQPGHFRIFVIEEPKPRLIAAPCYRDRVIHHAFAQVVFPYFDRKFYEHSYACRVGKGQHHASEYLSHMMSSASMMWGNFYVLKCDVTHYFDSIDHEILMDVIARTIRDEDVLWLARQQVTKCECFPDGVGIPKGCLTSQIFANVYLDLLDHYIKDGLGIKHYVRFMDDFILLHESKDFLNETLGKIRLYLWDKLKLTLNNKTHIFPGSHLIDFAGFRHGAGYKLPRKRNVRRATKRFKGLARCYERGAVDLDTVRSVVASFVGYIKHCKGYRSAGSALEKLVLRPPKEE